MGNILETFKKVTLQIIIKASHWHPKNKEKRK